MKKLTLTVLMVVMIVPPCLAQEIEPHGLFSIEGTLWNVCGIKMRCKEPYFPPPECNSMGFKQGMVYRLYDFGFWPEDFLSYIDTPVVSVVYSSSIFVPHIYIMQPTGGIGAYMSYGCYGHFGVICSFEIGIMYKVENNWIAPEIILQTAPTHGVQGTTLTNVKITSINTTFQDDPPVEISFDPPDGLTVSNINVESNTSIKFDLEIAVDAPVGTKHVIVTYDDGKKSIESINDGDFHVNMKDE